MQAELIIAIISSLLTNGPKFVTEIAKLFNDDGVDPTPEQIRALKITKDPEEYFEDRG